MVKLEFSYTKIFSDNITVFLITFVTLDILIEQLLVRCLMSEALLVSPIFGAFVVTEFIMTMGAEDFQSFITSYFIEAAIVVVSRTYIGPLVERAEAATQVVVIKLSLKYRKAREMFKGVLVQQLSM